MSTNAKIALGIGLLFVVIAIVWFMTRAQPELTTSTADAASADGGSGGVPEIIRTGFGFGGAIASEIARSAGSGGGNRNVN